MIYNLGSEKDLDLKLRYMRILWSLGYFARKNIELTRFEVRGRERNYTDVDVFGIKFDDELNSYITVCDCKSGRNAKTAERIFWLSGAMNATGANRGVFLRTSMDELKYIELANDLNMILLSEKHLSEIEKTYNIDPELFFGPFHKTEDLSASYLRDIRSYNKYVYEYINIKYWLSDPQEQIVTLISCCSKIKSYPSLNSKTKSFLLSYICSLLAISLLKLSRYVFNITDEYKENMIEQFMMGGLDEYIQRINLLSSFYSFMVKEIGQRYKQKYPLKEEEFVEGLKPYYIKYIKEIVVRVCNKPKAAKYLPQLLDVFTFEFLHEEKRFNNQLISLDSDQYKDLINLFRNYISFLERSEILTSELKTKFDEFLIDVESSRPD